MKIPCVSIRSIYDLINFSVPAINKRVLSDGASIYLMKNTDKGYEKSEQVGEFSCHVKEVFYHYDKLQLIHDIDELYRCSIDMLNECYPVPQAFWDKLYSSEIEERCRRLISVREKNSLVCEELGMDVANLPSTCNDFIYVKCNHTFRYHILDVPGNFTRFIADRPVNLAEDYEMNCYCKGL